MQLFKDNELFLDTVSHTKALRAKEVIGYFHTIKPNRIEAEALSGITIGGEEDLKRAAAYFHNQGVKNVFITLGAEGVFYSDEQEEGIVKAQKVIPQNATGAGDAFQAALVYAALHGYEIKEKVRFSMAASILAMSAKETISKNLSVEAIEKIMNQMEEK